MRSRYQFTTPTAQSTRRTPTRSDLSAALAAIQREIADAQEGDPIFFAEARSTKYDAEVRPEGQSVIVNLKHPPPGEISIFEFAIEDSGTIAQSGRLLSHTNEPSDFWSRMKVEDYKRIRMAVARIKALAGRASYLETVLGYGVTPRPQVSRRPEPTSPAQVPASRPKTDEAPRESKSEAQPSSQPPQATIPKSAKHAEQPESKKRGPKGFEGLHESQKSRSYSDMLASAGLTKMQYDCASLAWEHGLPIKEIASRVGRHRKTVSGHLEAAGKKVGMTRLKEGGAKQIAKTKPGSLD